MNISPLCLTNHFGEDVLKMFLENTGLEGEILTYASNLCSKYGCFIMNDGNPLGLHLLNTYLPEKFFSDYVTFPIFSESNTVFSKLLVDQKNILNCDLIFWCQDPSPRINLMEGQCYHNAWISV